MVGLLAHALGEDLGAAARDGAEPGLDQLGQHLAEGLLGHLRDLVELDHGEGLDVDLGPRALHRAQQVEVVLVGDLGPHARDHVHLGDGLVELSAEKGWGKIGRASEPKPFPYGRVDGG
jgi:hypothetical protein